MSGSLRAISGYSHQLVYAAYGLRKGLRIPASTPFFPVPSCPPPRKRGGHGPGEPISWRCLQSQCHGYTTDSHVASTVKAGEIGAQVGLCSAAVDDQGIST